MQPRIEVENISKMYRVGEQGRGSLRDAFQYFWRKNTAGLPFHPIAEEIRGPESNTFWALRDVSFKIEAGETVGILGGNGVGKSTLFKILFRLTEPTRGRAILHGRVTSLLEVGTGFHPELKGRENVFLNGAFLGMRKKEIEQEFDSIVDFSEVGMFIDHPFKHYSTGMAMRLALSVAFHLKSDILLLDEVLQVADSVFQTKCIDWIKKGARDGKAILFVSHEMEIVKRICSRLLTLDKGQLVRDEPNGRVDN